jgi:catechol 2,3-dioxygenase-like lactoylglutathione lyase family enzyme
MLNVGGVQHVGMGVKDYAVMKEFYGKTLEMTKLYAEFPEIWNAMGEVFRTSYHKFGGIMFQQEAGGIVVELISMSIPHPRPIRPDKRYGDVGVNKIVAGVNDVEKFYQAYKDRINFVGAPKSIPLEGWGDYNFVYARDPEKNLLEFISGPKVAATDTFGGLQWLGVGVTDLERSMEFYRSTAFDQTIVEPHEAFSGLVDEVSLATGTKVRSCLLANSKGGGMLELYECMKPRGRSIPLNTYWGDFGYLELCLETDDIHELAKRCKEMKLTYLHKPAVAFDMEDVDYWFQYIVDPDGIPIETLAVMPKGA